MSSPQWQQASEIVHAALERPPKERSAFINRVCNGNEALQQEVEILLRYYGTPPQPPGLEKPPNPADSLEQWWQPPQKSQNLRDAASAKPQVDWFAEADKTENTTEDLVVPDFAKPELHAVPPANSTVEIINELSKGYDGPKRPTAPLKHPLVTGQATPSNGSTPNAGPRSQFDQPSARRTNPLKPIEPTKNDEAGFNAPTVRPVFEQPPAREDLSPPTFRPLYEQQPKPAPPLEFKPVTPSHKFDVPSGKTESPGNSKPSASRASSPFDQASVRPSAPFDQASRPGPGNGAAGRSSANFNQPSGKASGAGTARQVDGRMLAHYQLQYEIGRGGMGRVYLAQDTRLGRRVALKLLLRNSTRDPERVRRFQQEARAASALNHPNILTIHEIGEVRDVHYLATEYVEGRTLRALIDRGRFKLSTAVEVAIQVASALEIAHRANIVHRDIKPENLMLRPDGYVKVLDFGIAKLVEPTTGETELHSGKLPSLVAEEFETQPGVVIGTANYMSPEQARGIRVDRRTDIFSLGIVLYEMLTGVCPFKGPTPSDTYAALLVRDPAPLAQQLDNIQPAALHSLQRILNRALDKDREQRYQSAKEFAADLKAFKQALEIGFPPEPARSGENPAAAAGLAATASGASAVAQTEEVAVEEILASVSGTAAQKTESSKASPQTRPHRGLVLGLLAVAFSVLLYFGYQHFFGRVVQTESIAVLPFEFTKTPRSDDGEREYLADGLTENLIQRLSQIASLKVIARNSVFRYKGKTPDPHEVGQALNVRTVLNGHITPRGNGLNITVELVDVRSSAVIWARQYESSASDLHKLQSNLANQIAEQLKLRLSGSLQQRLANQDTTNVEAYKLYLKGRHLWNQRTGDAIKRSVLSFQRAVILDPNYARAYAALADSYALAPVYSEMQPDEAIAAGKDAAARALELDPNLAEPHAALGFIRYQYEWNWEGAEQAFERAIALNENYATAHQWYSSLLSSLGRSEDAIREAQRARELDPISTPISTNLGAAFYYARRYDQAVQQFLRAIELNPNSAGVHAHLGMAYEQQDQHTPALAEFQRALALSSDNVQMKLRLSHALALAGQPADARKQLDELQQNAPPGAVPLYLVATIYCALNDREQAMTTLAQAVELREEGIVWLKVDPQLDSLRKEQRFQELLKNVGLEK